MLNTFFIMMNYWFMILYRKVKKREETSVEEEPLVQLTVQSKYRTSIGPPEGRVEYL